MRRAVLIGAGVAAVAGIVALGAAFGPDLWAYDRFETALEHHYTAYQADGGAWPQVQDTCALCHGLEGQSRNAQYASLAGLSAAYIEAQLHAFAEGRRHSTQMGPIAAGLSDGQIKTLAAYFARQTPGRNEASGTSAALEQRGQALAAAQNCATCHGDHLTGSAIAPRLAGQGEAYLADQLNFFKSGVRQDSTQAMNTMAASLSEEDIKAVARYTAGLPPMPK